MATPLHVLILEEAPQDAELIVHELHEAGFEPVWKRVENETEFLAELDQDPELILSDYSMPRLGALRSLELLHGSGRDIPFIVVSGSVGEDLAVAALHQGACDYFRKDRLGRLGQAIRQALEQRRLRDEKRRAEQALRESEELLRHAFEETNVAMVLTDLQNRFIRVNDAFARLFGYSKKEMLQLSMEEITHPEDVAESYAQRRMLLAGHSSFFQMEKRYVHKDGRVLWGLTNVSLVRDEHGRPNQYVGQVQDISDRKKAEAALQLAEAKYRSIFENAVDGIYQTTPSGRHLTANPTLARMYGYDSPEELIARVNDIEHQLYVEPGRRAEFMRLIQERGVVTGFESQIHRKDGSTMWISEHARVVRDGGGAVLYYEGMVEDISERKRAADSLHAMTDKLQSLVQASPLAIVAVDADGRVLSWNKAAERIFGWSEAEVLGQPLPIVPPQQQTEFQTMLAGKMQGETQTNLELSRMRKDGMLVDVAIWTAPLRNADGKVFASLALLADITERKRLEEQFRQAQKMEAIGRLAGGVAHDFNNLLTVILGCSEMVLAKLRQGDPLHELVEQIHKSGERAALLTRQLLAFSRKQVLMPVVLELNELLTEMEKLLLRLIGEDIELRIHRDPDLWRVKADAGQMEQVVMNLVVNARDAMPQGGKLTIETLNCRLDADYAARHTGVPTGNYVRLAVSDTGCGMDAATRARIFEPFFSTKGVKGTGLGLATVFGIVKQSGGFIDVYSEVGLGTTIKIYLPRDTTGAPSGKSGAGLLPVRSGTETILLVEDEDGVRDLAAIVLRQYGYRVLDSKNGGEAFLLCERSDEPIHLLVTDVVMPNMSGRQLAERLAVVRPAMKVLYLSGYTDDAIVQHGVLDAGTPFLHKPFSPEALARKVREVLDQSAAAPHVNQDPAT